MSLLVVATCDFGVRSEGQFSAADIMRNNQSGDGE